MLMAHPTILRALLERYETLRDMTEESNGAGTRLERELQDTIYTLCVSTGTREIGPALAAAREHVERQAFTTRPLAAEGTAA